MSIVTKRGDSGQTQLMFNRTVSKCHHCVEACGTLDELHSTLGLARAAADEPGLRQHLLQIQKDLVVLMGEVATMPEDKVRYVREGYPAVMPEMAQRLDALVLELENQHVTFKGWAYPGDNLSAAVLDLARTTCRRAERRVCALHEAGLLKNPQILIFLNRLADVLWLLSRWVETKQSSHSEAGQ
jgi:cob(I)alamin adenosyltransferase